MRILLIFTLLSSFSAFSAELSRDPTKLVEQMAACDVSWDDYKNSIDVEMTLMEFFTLSVLPDPDRRNSYLPKNPTTVFGLDVVKLSPSFGMSPGFMVQVGSDFSDVKKAVEESRGFNLECENEEKRCGTDISKTEAFVIMQGRSNVVLGCIYPYQK